MECFAYSRNFDLFLCSANQEEVDEIIKPTLLDLIENYKDDIHPNYLVSSLDTFYYEVAKQKEISKNPYRSSTLQFGRLNHKEPNADCYFVVKKDLSELYIVPYDIFYTTNVIDGDSHMFGYIDRFKFSSLINLTLHDTIYKEKSYTSFSHLDSYKKNIISFYKKYIEDNEICDGMWIFNQLYVYFQSMDIEFDEFEKLVKKYQRINLVPENYWNIDQVHFRNKKIINEEIVKEERRTYEEELLWLNNFDPFLNHYSLDVILFKEHFLDDIIDLKTLIKLLKNEKIDISNLPKNEAKKYIYYNLIDN